MAIVAGLAVLAAWVWAWNRCSQAPPEPPEASAPERDAQLEALRVALEAERERGRELAAQVEWLRLQIEELARRETPRGDGGDTAQPEAEPDEEARPARPEEELWFDAERLLAHGVPSHEVERLREIFDASEMAIIQLRNRAMREGWLRSGRYMQEMHDLRSSLREEIGDESFDLLLYATGRSNRVVITEVLRDSPGERAGLRPGDVVLSYDGRRIFKGMELQRGTTQGRPGVSVPMEVRSGDETRRLYLPLGPIGVKYTQKSLMPEVQ